MSLSLFGGVGSRVGMAAVALVVVAILSLPATSVSAHEERVVATDYTFTVGFINEPAVQNDTNGIWVEITKADKPVLAASDTLSAQVIFGDQTRDLTLTPAFGEDGVYESVFIPTQPGDYTFRLFGELEGVAVDESFTSSPEGFDSVAARSDLEFPAPPANGSRQETGAVILAFPMIVGGAVLALGAGALAVRWRAGHSHA